MYWDSKPKSMQRRCQSPPRPRLCGPRLFRKSLRKTNSLLVISTLKNMSQIVYSIQNPNPFGMKIFQNIFHFFSSSMPCPGPRKLRQVTQRTCRHPEQSSQELPVHVAPAKARKEAEWSFCVTHWEIFNTEWEMIKLQVEYQKTPQSDSHQSLFNDFGNNKKSLVGTQSLENKFGSAETYFLTANSLLETETGRRWF